MDSILRVRNLTKTYRKGEIFTYAVDNVSFEIFRGECVALSGPSGAGKSTILNQIGLLDEPSSGKIIIEGKEVELYSELAKSDFRLKHIGFVFQKYELLPELTALENVCLPLFAERGINDSIVKKAKEIFKELGLADRMNHYPYELSGGEQQRVSIARALLKKPKIILADEPTANLDSIAGKKVMNILRSLAHKYNMAVVVVNHEDDFNMFFDRIINFKDGKLVSIKSKIR